MTRPPRILIVDDEPFNVDLLEQQLDELGYETVSAGDGMEALEKITVEKPDVILLDVMMPKLDGFTVCRMLKDNKQTRLIPIVIMTALDAVEDRIQGIEAGADDFLTKPVDERELLARIRTTLKLRSSIEEKIYEHRRVGEHFAKFVPEAVRRLVAENPDAPELAKRDQDVSVLFLDICGYTRLSESLSPDELNQLTERYFSAYLDRVHESGGDISETSGDGLMVIFQHRDPERHAAMAVDAALAMLATTANLNRETTSHAVDLHIGVNSGIASVGCTRYEGQRGTRWVFTADGLTVNLAARLAENAEPRQILVSPETAKRVRNDHLLRSVGRKAFKNINERVEVYAVLPRSA